MDSIEPDALYDQRGEVSWSRPLLQGDIFEQIVLPGFGEDPRMVQIVTHPCAMRKGPALLPRITVAPIESYAKMTSQRDWIEIVLSDEEQTDEAMIDAEERVFDSWLSAGDPSPRLRLRDEVNHPDIRRETARAATARARDRDRNGPQVYPDD